MKTLLATLAAVPLLAATAAQAQTCADFNAMDADGRVSTVASLMQAEPGLFSGRAATNDTNSTNPANEVQPSQVTQQIESICAGDPNKTLVEAAREQTAPTLNSTGN